MLLVCPLLRAQSDDLPSRTIPLPKLKGTTYEMLNLISERSGYLFMYDSKVIDSNRKVKISEGDYTLKEAIALACGDAENIRTRTIGNHILLYKAETKPAEKETPAPSPAGSYFTLEGTVRERETGDPIPYCAVGVVETGMGTITNQNGQFLLKVPDSLQNAYIHVSHIGYEAQRFPARLLSENNADLYLDTRFIPLEAVIVRLVNPQKLIKDMLDHIPHNYSDKPYYLTTFYREGVDRKRGFANLTEAVFRVYKTGYDGAAEDRVKMVKMRTISNNRETDTVIMKMKAGVNACLMLDVIKNIPDFLVLGEENMYRYTKIDMAVTGDRLAHVIAFEQNPGIKGPLYKGELYIDENNYALLHARFRIHPDYIKQARSMLVVKKSKSVEITPREAVYTVSYYPRNGKYYVNHTRGDLIFSVKKKRKILSGTAHVHTWFEMVTCNIDTVNVKRFSVAESQPARNVLSETNYVYDETFWESFNTIMPEEKLSEAISRISSKIEESVAKEKN